jgi:hypothetical protein
MRCDAMRCDAMRCDAMRCDAMRCDAMRCDAMRCDAMRSVGETICKTGFHFFKRAHSLAHTPVSHLPLATISLYPSRPPCVLRHSSALSPNARCLSGCPCRNCFHSLHSLCAQRSRCWPPVADTERVSARARQRERCSRARGTHRLFHARVRCERVEQRVEQVVLHGLRLSVFVNLLRGLQLLLRLLQFGLRLVDVLLGSDQRFANRVTLRAQLIS